MATVYNLIATSCPAQQAAPTNANLQAAYDSSTGTAYGAKNFATGDTDTVPGKLRWNAKLLDLVSQVGSPGAAVLDGLTPSLASGLNITIGIGRVTCGGALIELTAATQITLTDSATNRVWLKRDGTLEVITTTAAPAIPGCHIWTFVVAAGTISTNWDRSGVFIHQGGLIVRRTADLGAPSDTPTVAYCFLTQTAAGMYLWDGISHKALPSTTQQNVRSSNFQVLAATKTLVNSDANVQRYKVAAPRDVVLPGNTGLSYGHYFEIANDATSTDDLSLYAADGTTLLATITPGSDPVIIRPIDNPVSSGTPIWPNS